MKYSHLCTFSSLLLIIFYLFILLTSDMGEYNKLKSIEINEIYNNTKRPALRHRLAYLSHDLISSWGLTTKE